MSDSASMLEIRNVTWGRPAAPALHDVSVSLRRGEIVGLMGASGAGKSTLLQALAGALPHGPPVRWEGGPPRPLTPQDAAALGIRRVLQAGRLPDAWTVADALTLGRESQKHGWRLDRPALRLQAEEALDGLGLSLDPSALLGSLTAAEHQWVVLARALQGIPRCLLLDDPTAPLPPQETDRFFEMLGDLQARGTAIVFASERFAEVEALATRVIVLREGRLAGELERSQLNRRSLSSLMVGHELELPLKELIEPGEERLKVTGLSTARFPSSSVNFSLREGEIVGLAGLVGSGRSSLLRTLFGLDPRLHGSMEVDGMAVQSGSPRHAMDAGLALIPSIETSGTGPSHATLEDVLTLPSLPRLAAAGIVSRRAVARLGDLLNEFLSITDGSTRQRMDQLHPDQHRLAAVARWIARQPSVVLLDDPTRGVTLTARAALYEAIERLAERGAAVLFASESMDELLRLSDRLIVLRQGTIAGCLTREDDFSERGIMRLAAGLSADDGQQ